MTVKWDPKDPDEVDDRTLLWRRRLATGDTIITSDWTPLDEGYELVIDSDQFTDNTTTAWLSGGLDGSTYRFLNRITTNDGRTLDETVKISVRTR